jgi:hypothetical protein
MRVRSCVRDDRVSVRRSRCDVFVPSCPFSPSRDKTIHFITTIIVIIIITQNYENCFPRIGRPITVVIFSFVLEKKQREIRIPLLPLVTF